MDANFGNPMVRIAFPAGLAALTGNRVVVVGTSSEYGGLFDGVGEDQALAVFNPDGTNAFTKTGAYLQPPFGMGTTETAGGYGAAPAAGGSFFTTGSVSEAGGRHLTLAKYNADGSLDQTFNGGSSPWGPGTVDTSFRGNDVGQALALDGRR